MSQKGEGRFQTSCFLNKPEKKARVAQVHLQCPRSTPSLYKLTVFNVHYFSPLWEIFCACLSQLLKTTSANTLGKSSAGYNSEQSCLYHLCYKRSSCYQNARGERGLIKYSRFLPFITKIFKANTEQMQLYQAKAAQKLLAVSRTQYLHLAPAARLEDAACARPRELLL